MYSKKRSNICAIKRVCVCSILIVCMVALCSCTKKKLSVHKEKDLDFAVVEQSEIPEKLAEEILAKKENGFQLTYKDGEYMYIAIGYGAQETGGYSVRVKELFLAKNVIYIDSSLVGPEENDMVLNAKTYPYVVVKLENRNLNVVFNS